MFECGTRIWRVIHGRDARATLANCTITHRQLQTPLQSLDKQLIWRPDRLATQASRSLETGTWLLLANLRMYD